MSVKQINGEGGRGQSRGPIHVRLCRDLEGPAFLQWSLWLTQPEGLLETSPPTPHCTEGETEAQREELTKLRASKHL